MFVHEPRTRVAICRTCPSQELAGGSAVVGAAWTMPAGFRLSFISEALHARVLLSDCANERMGIAVQSALPLADCYVRPHR